MQARTLNLPRATVEVTAVGWAAVDLKPTPLLHAAKRARFQRLTPGGEAKNGWMGRSNGWMGRCSRTWHTGDLAARRLGRVDGPPLSLTDLWQGSSAQVDGPCAALRREEVAAAKVDGPRSCLLRRRGSGRRHGWMGRAATLPLAPLRRWAQSSQLDGP